MNVLHIISSPAAGGVEIYIKDLAKAQVISGHSASICFLNHAQDIGRSSTFETKFLLELEEYDVEYFFIGKQARRLPWLGMLAVHRFVRKNKIQIYHSHLTYGIIFGAFLSIPKVYTLHSIIPRVNSVVYRILLLFINQQIGISDACTNALIDFSKKKVVQINNAVDQKKMGSVSLRTLNKTGKVECICVGRISEPKNYKLLVDAIYKLPLPLQSRLNVSIAGEGSQKDTEELIDYISKYELSNIITLLGNQNDIPSLLANSDLFLMTSAWEGLPIALIEAAMSGLPCIVTDVGGCSEVIETCKNGTSSPAGDVQSYADALNFMISNPEYFSGLSENAIKNSHYFSIEKSCIDHIDIYKKLLVHA